MKKNRVTCIFLIFGIIFLSEIFTGCTPKFDDKNFIGKTSSDIMNEYGAFDCTYLSADENGIYKNCKCGYTTKESTPGLLEASDEEIFFITFDENGIAVSCEYGYRPGG